MARQTTLPHNIPPRIISQAQAASYCGVSSNTFSNMVAAGQMPKPKKLSVKRRGWDVRELDEAITLLPVEGDEKYDDTWDDVDGGKLNAS